MKRRQKHKFTQSPAPGPRLDRWILLIAGALVAGSVLLVALVESDSGTSAGERRSTVGVTPDAPRAVRDTYRIVREYPHDAGAYTQGLVYADGYLFEGTGLYGESSLRKVEIETGMVVKRIDLGNSLFGEGITILNNKIYQLTWRSNVGFVYDMHTFSRLSQFQYPTEGWGLTHDGTHLIMSDGSATLYFMHPETFEQIRRIKVLDDGMPVDQLNELEYIRGEIYANVWHSDDIVRIDPATGVVTGRIDLSNLIEPTRLSDPEAVLNGIAYDANAYRLFVTGKLWPALYEIRVVR